VTTFSLTTGYAIEALACLARRGSDSMLVREIALITEMPLPYLSKIFQRLGDAGIVESKRGYKGGVKLSRPPRAITLLEIHVAAESGKTVHAAGECTRRESFWEAFHESYRKRLAAMSLADVLEYEVQA
jgi:Rrf2 family protein